MEHDAIATGVLGDIERSIRPVLKYLRRDNLWTGRLNRDTNAERHMRRHTGRWIRKRSSKRVGPDAMRKVETEIGWRARRLMPFVIAVLYMAGVTMAWQYREDLARPLDSSFATLLSIKIALAASVLTHFITAVILGARGKLRSRHTKVIHLSVFFHVVVIVFLAKAMFYISW